jgi:hypothetical protein
MAYDASAYGGYEADTYAEVEAEQASEAEAYSSEYDTGAEEAY